MSKDLQGDIALNPKGFSDALTMDLSDEDIRKAWKVIDRVRTKWEEIFRSKLRHENFTVEEAMKLVDQFEDELAYDLATQCQLAAAVDVMPCLEGKPMQINFRGPLEDHEYAKYGMDHERKGWEVKRAKDRNEDFLGSGSLD